MTSRIKLSKKEQYHLTHGKQNALWDSDLNTPTIAGNVEVKD